MSTPEIKTTEPVAANATDPVSATPAEDATATAAQQEPSPEEQPYKLTISTPNGAIVPIVATAQETIQDLKQVVSETPATIEYSCFYLSLAGQRLNDFTELGAIEGLEKDSQLLVVEDQYTERDARLHVSRLRELLVGPVTANPIVAGLDAGASIFSTIKYPDGVVDDNSGAATAAAVSDAAESESASRTTADNTNSKQKSKKGGKKAQPAGADGKKHKKGDDVEQANGSDADQAKPKPVNHALKGFNFNTVPPFETLSASAALKSMVLPACLKQIILSGWNPVPRYRQLKGDLLYLLVTTLENQNYHITCSRNGFYVNSSSL
ncbi:Intracellular distribution of mitochondria, partial [Coemansia erecta]